LTVGYGFFVRKSRRQAPTLIAHELAHVAQYERLGGISAFLVRYLAEINEYGCNDAPLELEAVAFEKCRAWELASTP
jgi:hypothetical protein